MPIEPNLYLLVNQKKSDLRSVVFNMDTINNFKLLDDLDGYDKVANPNGLNMIELLPHGVTWSCNGKINEIKHNNKIIALLLKNNNGIALVKSPFNKCGNNAYIISPLNEIVWDVGSIIRNDTDKVIFSDVYYISDELNFFINIDVRDYRFTFEPKIGKAGKLTPSY